MLVETPSASLPNLVWYRPPLCSVTNHTDLDVSGVCQALSCLRALALVLPQSRWLSPSDPSDFTEDVP